MCWNQFVVSILHLLHVCRSNTSHKLFCTQGHTGSILKNKEKPRWMNVQSEKFCSFAFFQL